MVIILFAFAFLNSNQHRTVANTGRKFYLCKFIYFLVLITETSSWWWCQLLLLLNFFFLPSCFFFGFFSFLFSVSLWILCTHNTVELSHLRWSNRFRSLLPWHCWFRIHICLLMVWALILWDFVYINIEMRRRKKVSHERETISWPFCRRCVWGVNREEINSSFKSSPTTRRFFLFFAGNLFLLSVSSTKEEHLISDLCEVVKSGWT